MMDHEQEVNFFDPSHQFKLYDALTTLLNLIRKTLTLIQKAHVSKTKLYCIDQSLQQIHQNIKNCQQIAQSFPSPTPKQFANTIQRFICRLIEIIISYRHKFVEASSCLIIVPLLKQVQSTLLGYGKNTDFPLTLQKIFFLLKRHIEILSTENQPKAELGLNPVQYQRKFQKKKSIQSRSQAYLSKIMSDLVSSFKLIGFLDIDFQNYKQVFICSKNNNSELFQDCMLRNSFIAKQMNCYSSSFSQYLLRKKNKIFANRKNRFAQYRTSFKKRTSGSPEKISTTFIDAFQHESTKQDHSNLLFAQTVEGQSKIDAIQNQKQFNNSKKFDKKYQTKAVFGQSIMQKLNLFGQTRKNAYHVKKINITASKINIQKQSVDLLQRQSNCKKQGNRARMTFLLNNRKKDSLHKRQKKSAQLDKYSQQARQYLTTKYIPSTPGARIFKERE